MIFFSFFVYAFSQSDGINISASFAQSIELRVIGNSSVEFVISSLEDYQKGLQTSYHATGFEVASSTSFEVQAEFTPFTNSAGDQIDMRNMQYRFVIPADQYDSERGVRWDIPTPDIDMFQGYPVAFSKLVGCFTGAGGAKTILVPGPAGNAGDFETNRFHIQFLLGFAGVNDALNIPRMLDQNISPGTYNCTMTLTAIPQAL